MNPITSLIKRYPQAAFWAIAWSTFFFGYYMYIQTNNDMWQFLILATFLGGAVVTEQPFYGDILTSLQAELPALSTNSRLYIVEGATHEGLVAEREHALVVAAAIRQVLEPPQTGQPLADSSLSILGEVNQ